MKIMNKCFFARSFAKRLKKKQQQQKDHQKGSTKDDIDLAIIQIAEKLLQEPSEKTIC